MNIAREIHITPWRHARIAMIVMIAGIAGLLLLAPAASAAGASGLSPADQKFLREAAQGGMMEVELGRLAGQKAASADVKDFGQRMVTDHSQANDKLKSVAADKSFTLPTELSPEQRNEMDKLAKLSGAEFDRMYMEHMVKDHKKDVAEFDHEASHGGDAAVRGFAKETLPTLREHLTLAQQVDHKVDTSHGASSGAKH